MQRRRQGSRLARATAAARGTPLLASRERVHRAAAVGGGAGCGSASEPSWGRRTSEAFVGSAATVQRRDAADAG